MKSVINQDKCANCRACYNKCPNQAIVMKENHEGFFIAIIDQNKCVECGLCRKICPVINVKEKTGYGEKLCHAIINSNNEIKIRSSSGGVFGALSNFVLKKDGIVCAPSYDDEFKVAHMFIDNSDDLIKAFGSKYVESDLGNIFKKIKQKLDDKHLLLFSGTPCQVAGLKQYLNVDYQNLITLDIVCHGVPTPKLYKKYLSTFGVDKIKGINFRDKTNGWTNYGIKIKLENSQYFNEYFNDDYMKLFLSDVALKSSCYTCAFKNGKSSADITIGDFWGISKVLPDVDYRNGVTMVISNTNKGADIINSFFSKEEILGQCKIKDVCIFNKALIFGTKKPKDRDEFFLDLDNKSVKELSKKYGKKENNQIKIKRAIKKLLKR